MAEAASRPTARPFLSDSVEGACARLPLHFAACCCAEALLDVVTGRLQAAERTLKEDEEAVRGWTFVQFWHG